MYEYLGSTGLKGPWRGFVFGEVRYSVWSKSEWETWSSKIFSSSAGLVSVALACASSAGEVSREAVGDGDWEGSDINR
jgi:hypothetical protein